LDKQKVYGGCLDNLSGVRGAIPNYVGNRLRGGNKIGLRGGKMFDKRDIVLKGTIIGTRNVLIYFFLYVF
jgi:hypothetical protein